MPAHHAVIEGGNVSRYMVQSADVISDMRVNVFEENSDKVIWYKERFLSDDEIVENFVENATSTILWTVHRPQRGWYIRLRSPTFPPGVFISLLPVPKNALHHADAALSFACRTNVNSHASFINVPFNSMSPISDCHEYPPSPPQAPPLIVQPPSPTSVHAKIDKLARTPTQITQFVLAPETPPQVAESASFLSRAISVFTRNRPSNSYSFTLSPISPSIPPPTHSYVPNSTSSIPTEHSSSTTLPTTQPTLPSLPLSPTPLLIFHDRTPIYTVRTVNGLLEIDQTEERSLGVQTSFWIAVALTYLQFLEERESYLAAIAD